MDSIIVRPKFPFTEVDGLLSQEDRVNLRDLAERCASLDGQFCEVGSYKGLSALCILSQRTGIAVPIICFDWFEDDKLKQFTNNLSAFLERVFIYRGDFKAQQLPEKARFSLCFCDHSHTLEDTRAAYEMFWPRISKGGVLAFHDYLHPDYQEPRQFLDSLPHKRILENSILAFEKE